MDLNFEPHCYSLKKLDNITKPHKFLKAIFSF